ncbi:MAG: branched-chain amino acid ABC transporter permease [Acidimicrobiales bacterium]
MPELEPLEDATTAPVAVASGARHPVARWSGRLVPLVIVAAVLAAGPSLYNNLDFLTTLAIYVLLAQGVNIVYGFTGYLPFGFVGFFGAGIYGSSLAIVYWHVGGYAAIGLGALTSVVAALILSPLLRLSGAYFALATLAASQALYFIVANESWTFGESGMSLPLLFSSTTLYVVAVVAVVVALIVVLYVRDSHFGLSLRAIRSDAVSAAMAGVNVVRTRTIAWLVSAALAGIAGALWAMMTSAFYAETPFDLTISVYAIVFALFGGVRTVVGPVVGTVVLYSLYQYIGISNPQYFELIYGLLIVVLVLFLPGGLSSLVGGRGDRPAWWNRLVRRRAAPEVTP